LFTKSILQKRKLFISRVKLFKKDIQKIHPAIQACDIISLLDSFVINFVLSMKNISKLQIIQNKNANK
jgi:hypothetical protein